MFLSFLSSRFDDCLFFCVSYLAFILWSFFLFFSSAGYGSATRLLRFPVLTPEQVVIEAAAERLTGDLVSDTYTAGLHTLSGCGDFTLIDVKRIDRSRGRQWLDFKRRLRRLAGR